MCRPLHATFPRPKTRDAVSHSVTSLRKQLIKLPYKRPQTGACTGMYTAASEPRTAHLAGTPRPRSKSLNGSFALRRKHRELGEHKSPYTVGKGNLGLLPFLPFFPPPSIPMPPPENCFIIFCICSNCFNKRPTS